MQPVEIRASGMVTGVGLTAPSSCAAIRAGIARFQETPFVLDGEGLYGSIVRLGEPPLKGRAKLLRMAAMAARECLDAVEERGRGAVHVILCLPEIDRPGRIDGLDQRFLAELRRDLGLGSSPIPPGLVVLGRVGGAQAVADAAALIADGLDACIVVGVDTYFTAETLTAYHDQDRLKTDDNVDGFIPGEAAAAVLLGRPQPGSGQLVCLGIGAGVEPAPIESAEPLRAEGLVQAIRGALQSSGRTYRDLDYRIADVNGEQYGFKEAALALTRTLRERKPRFDIWHPVDCIGEVGAAIGPAVLSVALAAARKGYAPGPGVLCHFSSDGGARAAMVLMYT